MKAPDDAAVPVRISPLPAPSTSPLSSKGRGIWLPVTGLHCNQTRPLFAPTGMSQVGGTRTRSVQKGQAPRFVAVGGKQVGIGGIRIRWP